MSETTAKRKWVRWSLYGGGALLLIASFFVVRFLTAAGMFTTLTQEVDADCTAIEAVPGPEDIVIDRERRMAFVAATDRRLVQSGEPGSDAVRGGIYVIDLEGASDSWRLRPVTAFEPEDFRPHGIGLYIDGNGRRFLHVVNHPARGGHTVEIFEVMEEGLLEHRQTVESDLLVSPNDVQPVSADTFYATNDHGAGTEFGQLIENFFLLSKSNVVYWDGEEARIVANDISFANGINVSPDGDHVYVAGTIDMKLRIYEREAETGALEMVDSVYLATGLDNIDVHEDGRLLIGAHPKMTAFLDHASDPAALSPSQVLEVIPHADGGGEARTLMLDNGEELSGSSVAAGYDGLMLVAGVFEPKILVCSQKAALSAQ